MDIAIQKKAAAQFYADWKDKGDEKQDTQNYWNQLLRTVYGVEKPEQYIAYEKRVPKGFIDGYIADTRVLIEQKGKKFSLDEKEPRQDRMVTPYEQARDYVSQLPLSEKPNYIITCNFQTIRIYDCDIQASYNRKTDTWYAPFEEIQLDELETEFRRLNFLVNITDKNIKKEMKVSLEAGELVGILYDELLKQYKDPEDAETLRNLNQLCVRFVFCFYAEDAGLFERDSFHDYLQAHRSEARLALKNLFRVLDTKPEERDPYDDDDLLAFPYVNGGLFADESVVIPRLTSEIVDLILQKASEDFDWSAISPTIFGAVFESTLNPQTRRGGGMHYTSIENIHKVIDPLFLDDLKLELAEILDEKEKKKKEKRLKEFQTKLTEVVCLDPACGSGNFLTESYLSLRRLENQVIRELLDLRKDQVAGQMMLFTESENPIQVSIGQFYGIEINDFAVTVARTALWIAEAQMFQETRAILTTDMEFFPLESYTNIHEGNALRMEWEKVVARDAVKYVLGNPPFVGYAFQSSAQKDDMAVIMGKFGKNLDYVSGWYKKAVDYMQQTAIRAALVSTNSISQGEQVAVLWKPLFESGLHIDFAYQTFRWDSEASIKAHVHCVIIGFSVKDSKRKRRIYADDRMIEVENINGYLAPGPNVFIERRSKPLWPVPAIYRGSQPTDDGNLILTVEEKNDLIAREPLAEKFIRPYMMGKDFISRKPRYCIWLANLSGQDLSLLKKCPTILMRIENVRKFRENSKKAATREKASTPMVFDENHECTTDYIAIPVVSSERRRYIPMELLSKDIIAGDKLFMMPNATRYDFGILTSNIHMAWMRAVCGRLKSDYSYSNTIVYNNFPWPSPTDAQRSKIEKTAKGILDARALYAEASLADLYDPLTMPSELNRAHKLNDLAVMEAYGFTKGTLAFTSEAACVAELMMLYQKKVDENGTK